jgi:catechol 2,3-dioxygenase-like lactoylglutathione lyase family enzyme
MSDTAPLFDQIDLVVRDMEATIRFYRRLGLAIPEEKIWRTASGAHHVDLDMPNGTVVHFDSVALTRAYDAGWREPAPGGGGRVVIGFSVPSRDAVDARYADLVGAGYAGTQPPYDTFWGARYAVVEDPDGNPVGLMSPPDPSKRRAPPAL